MGTWVTGDQKNGPGGDFLIFDRREQEPSSPNVQSGTYWYAWEKDLVTGEFITDLGRLKRVVYLKVDEIIVDGKKIPVMKWVKLGSTTWTSGKNVWDSISQSWIDYQ